MLTISFRGWWQLRMAIDPDPNDEPRGISGPTVAVPGEPDFDGVLRLQDPVCPRYPHEHDIGVDVYEVCTADPSAPNGIRRLPDHPLLGARVNLLDGPIFGERGFVVLYQKMPIEPFHLELAGDGVVLRINDLWDPTRPTLTYIEVASYYPELLERRCIAVQPQSPLVASVTGIVDYAQYRRDRREQLARLLGERPPEPATRAGLELRIRMLEKDDLVKDNRGLVSLLLPAQQFLGLCGFYSFPIRGVPHVSDPERRLPGMIGTSQPWSISFWMGGYDVDSLTGYMMGTLTVPFYAPAA
ncbi:MAG: hypothetical protein ACRDMX_08810 [Solirubrobacteraceae bacterium]